jgi:DNA-binding MarR family transcriptional regulator
MNDPARTTPVTDPLALRALAHPFRWKLLEVLASEDTATAKRCAELTGESTATCSYHLRVLAKYGYITRVPGREWREKPWRLVGPKLEVSSSGLDQEGAAASRAAAAALVDHEMTQLKEALRRSPDEPGEWQNTNKITATTAWFTAAEARQAAAEIEQFLGTYRSRSWEQADRPAGARQVRLFAAITPVPPPLRSDDQ